MIRIRILVYGAALVRRLGNSIIATIRVLLWPRRRPRAVARVCVYRIGAIGDLVTATPALFAIRRAYPNAHLTLLTTPGKFRGARHALDLFQDADWIDEVILYELDDIATKRQRWAFANRLRGRDFDVWFDLPLDRARFSRMIRDMIFARVLGVRWAFGWRLEHVAFAAKAEAEVEEFPDEVERLARLLYRCGIEAAAPKFPGLIDSAQYRPMNGLLPDGERKWGHLIAIAPGARRICNLWPSERFAAVGETLTSDGATVFLIGGADDAAICARITEEAGGRLKNLAGKLSLMQSCELLRRCDLLIGVDSGPVHLAAAVGTRCLGLFSERNQRRRWFPHGEHHVVLHGNVECHTCLLDVCPYDNRCMKQISVEQVLEAAHEMLRDSFCDRVEMAEAREAVE